MPLQISEYILHFKSYCDQVQINLTIIMTDSKMYLIIFELEWWDWVLHEYGLCLISLQKLSYFFIFSSCLIFFSNMHQSSHFHVWLCVNWFSKLEHEMTDMMWEYSQGIWTLINLWLTTCPKMNIHETNPHWQWTQPNNQMRSHLGTCKNTKKRSGEGALWCIPDRTESVCRPALTSTLTLSSYIYLANLCSEKYIKIVSLCLVVHKRQCN